MAYSITDRASFLGLREHCKQLARTRDVDNLAGVPITLFANKCDLAPQRQVSKAEGEAFAAEIGARYLEGSAKQYLNINEAFEHLVRSIRVHRAPLSTNNGTNKKVVNKKQKKAGCTIL